MVLAVDVVLVGVVLVGVVVVVALFVALFAVGARLLACGVVDDVGGMA